MNSTKDKESKANSKKSNSKSQKSNGKKTKAPVEPKITRSSSVRVTSVNNKNALNSNNNNNNNVKTKDLPLATKPIQPPPGFENAPKFERSNSFSITRRLSKLITSITGSKENLVKPEEENSPFKFTRSRSMILLRRTNRRSVIEPQLEQLSEETEKSPDQPDSKSKTPDIVPEEEFEFKKPPEPPSPVHSPQENFQTRRSSSFIASFRRTLASTAEKKKPLNPKWSASLQSLQAMDNMVSYDNMKFIDYDKFHDYEKNLERQLSTLHLETAVDVPPTPSTPTVPVVVRRPKKISSASSKKSRLQSTQSAIFDSDFEHNLDKPKNVYRFSLDSRKLERLNEFSGGSMILNSKLDALNLEDGSVGRRRRPVSFYIGSVSTLRKSRSTSEVADAGAAIQVSC